MDIDIEEYLKMPNTCLYCGSKNTTGSDTGFSYINAWRNVICNECHKEWTEEFTITSIINANLGLESRPFMDCPHCKHKISIKGLTGDSYGIFKCPKCNKDITEFIDKGLLENDMF